MLLERLKGWLIKMGWLSGTRELLGDVPDFDGYYDACIGRWRAVYAGRPEWLRVRKSGLSPGERTMAQLGAAQVLCAELANLVFSENVSVVGESETVTERVGAILQENAFWKRFPALLEYCMAEGGAVLKTYLSGGKVRLDYVTADSFFPTAWDGDAITEGVFVGRTVRGRDHFTLLERHAWRGSDYVIRNDLFRSRTGESVGDRVPLDTLYPGMAQESVIQGLDRPLFCYFRPNIANNLSTTVPLGVSVFAGAMDTLQSLDIAFDSFQREFVLGRKRIIVPASAVKGVIDPDTGERRRYFDASDEVFQAINLEDNEQLRIVDNTVELRVDEHVAAINALLNILCMQTGLSAGSLSFDSAQGLKTATEVISQNSKTYRTKQSHQNLIREAVADTAHNIAALAGIAHTQEFEVRFDDSILIDKQTERMQDKEDVRDGIMHKWEFRCKWYGEDEQTAKRMAGDEISDDEVMKFAHAGTA